MSPLKHPSVIEMPFAISAQEEEIETIFQNLMRARNIAEAHLLPAQQEKQAEQDLTGRILIAALGFFEILSFYLLHLNVCGN